MLTTTWQEEIATLKQNLNKEIKKISANSEITIPNHICINNLKSKLERLDEIEKILSIDKYQIAFIGTIGKGKTTAICHLFNLISEFKVTKTIAGKTKDVLETKELLSTGAGRTTICEVIIKAAEETYIEIEPFTVDEMESIILEFCDYIANKDNPIAYTKQDGVFTSKYLNSLEDVPPLILQSSNKLEKDTSEFEKAITGNFNSFTYLANKYGKYKLNTIFFKLKGQEIPISGYFFEIHGDKVECHVYGKSPKKKQSFNYQEFEKLISITY